MVDQNVRTRTTMREIALALIAATALLAGSASANYKIDLIWADTGTPTLEVTDPGTNPGVSTCHPNPNMGGGPKAGYCLLVVLTAGTSFNYSSTSIGWDAAASGIAVSYIPSRAMGPIVFQAPHEASVFTPVSPTSISDCTPDCDTSAGSWGGEKIPGWSVGPGAYLLGSITFDLSAANNGAHTILNFPRSGFDGLQNGEGPPGFRPVQLNNATLQVGPLDSDGEDPSPSVPALGPAAAAVLALLVLVAGLLFALRGSLQRAS